MSKIGTNSAPTRKAPMPTFNLKDKKPPKYEGLTINLSLDSKDLKRIETMLNKISNAINEYIETTEKCGETDESE